MKHTHETITETGVKRAVEQMIEATAVRESTRHVR